MCASVYLQLFAHIYIYIDTYVCVCVFIFIFIYFACGKVKQGNLLVPQPSGCQRHSQQLLSCIPMVATGRLGSGCATGINTSTQPVSF